MNLPQFTIRGMVVSTTLDALGFASFGLSYATNEQEGWLPFCLWLASGGFVSAGLLNFVLHPFLDVVLEIHFQVCSMLAPGIYVANHW